MRFFYICVSSLAAVCLLATACGGTSGSDASTELKPGSTVTLITHESFVTSEGVLEAFESIYNLKLEVLKAGDVGSLLAQLVLTKDNPIADVLFGIDNTFVQRALEEGLFLPYEPEGLEAVSKEFIVGSDVTPIDYGDVCVNYWKDGVGDSPPKTLEDLTLPRFKGEFVTQNPETSSPGLAFLLATIAKYGEDGWEDYWRRLRENDLRVTSGWSEAYYTEFKAGGGERNIVTSYATSPVAEVVFGEPIPESAPTGVLIDGCFRQVEYGGILKGAKNIAGAQKLLDFMLGKRFQEDIPLSMFVYPASNAAQLPPEFIEHGVQIQSPLTLSPEAIAKNRDTWTKRWVEIVLR